MHWPKCMLGSEEDVSLFTMAQYCFHCAGVITGLTESFSIIFHMVAILLSNSFVAISESDGKDMFRQEQLLMLVYLQDIQSH